MTNLRPILTRLAIRVLGSALALGGAGLYLTVTEAPDTETRVAIDAPTPAEVVLIESNDCWSSEQSIPVDMVGQLPGHAVIGLESGQVLLEESHRALEQVFGEVDHSIRVFAFCR